MHNRNRHSGFTLLELIMSLALIVILAGLVVPGFAGLVRRTQTEIFLYELVNAFQLARSAAISQRSPVVFCANENDSACGPDWSDGAFVFTDANKNRKVDGDDRVFAHVAPPPVGSRVIMKAALGKTYLQVMPTGLLENTAGSLVICPPGANPREARNVIFNRTGRMRFGEDRNRDGIRENAEGQPLSCPS